jgi:hypothetical protein
MKVETLFWHFPGDEENHEKRHSREPVSGPRFKHRTHECEAGVLNPLNNEVCSQLKVGYNHFLAFTFQLINHD